MNMKRRIERLVGSLQNRIVLAGHDYRWRNFHASTDGVAVFPRLGLVYNRIRKSANTTMSAFLAELEYGAISSDPTVVKRSIRHPYDLGWSDAKRIPDYYSLLVVREPYARILSAWLNKLEGPAPAHFRRFPGYGLSGPEGFEAFVRWLDNGGLRAKRHWTPQADLLMQPVEKFSRIARVENLPHDIAGCLRDLGLDPSPASRLDSPHKVEAGTAKITKAADRLSAYYTDTSREIVGRLYRMDFEMFGYAR